jgi:hypothetical protein
MSMIQSAALITSLSMSLSKAASSLSMSSKCRPVVGSSQINNAQRVKPAAHLAQAGSEGTLQSDFIEEFERRCQPRGVVKEPDGLGHRQLQHFVDVQPSL